MKRWKLTIETMLIVVFGTGLLSTTIGLVQKRTIEKTYVQTFQSFEEIISQSTSVELTRTNKPLPTDTLQPTFTFTSTYTKTSTYTPTITNSPTETKTPTLTFTPTITFTPSITPTSTATLRGGEETGCIPNNPREQAVVTKIIDGDTIEVNMEGELYKVRLIGIDSPESGQKFYDASKYALSIYAPVGSVITMIKDASETDQYGRLLRYIISGYYFVNHKMVFNGYATDVRYPPDTACSDIFSEANQSAMAFDRGMYQPTPTPVPIVYPTTRYEPIYPSDPGNGNCDPSYPDVCIPPYPPDLDCKDIPYRNFRVTGADQHGFDGDDDGIGCET